MNDDELVAALRRRCAESERRHPVVTVAELANAEARLGFTLAPMHRRFYLEVANGHAGFECGLYGIPSARGGHVDQGRSLLEERAMHLAPADVKDAIQRHHEFITLLARAVPICDLGCGRWCWSDVGSTERVLMVGEGVVRATALTFATLCEAWVTDTLRDALYVFGPDREGIHPFTKQKTVFKTFRPRGDVLLTFFEWTGP